MPAANLVELPFKNMEADPLGCLQQVYRTFGWVCEGEEVAGGLAPARKMSSKSKICPPPHTQVRVTMCHGNPHPLPHVL